jgi:superfamily II DNA/RNA helicase
LAPTRELAVQIKEECDKFGASSDIKNTVVYGGVPKFKQVSALKSGVEIVIGTPGRLIDHVRKSILHVDFYNFYQTLNVFGLVGTREHEFEACNLSCP